MKKLLFVILFIQFSASAIKVQIEHQNSILDIRNKINRISHDILKMERDYNTRMSELRSLKSIQSSILRLRDKANNLHKEAIINTDEGKGIGVNLNTISADVRAMASELNVIIQKINIDKLFTRRVAARFYEIAYHLEVLLDACYDGRITDQYTDIQELSGKYKSRKIEFIVQGDYEDFYYGLVESIKKVKKLRSTFRKLGRKSVGHHKNKRIKRDPLLMDLSNRSDAVKEILDKLQDELVDTLSSDEKVNELFLKESILKAYDQYSALVNIFNNKVDSDVNLKQSVSLALDDLKSLTTILKINEKSIVDTKVSNLSKKEFSYQNGNEVCHTLGSPGHIILQKSKSNRTSLFTEFGQNTSRAIQLLEFFKFEDLSIDYSHAEVVTKINNAYDIQTWSYYPWMFNVNKQETEHRPAFVHVEKGWRWCSVYTTESGRKINDCKNYSDFYRSNYTMLNVKGSSLSKELKRKEKALKKVEKKEGFFRKGLAVCSDFVNWAFDNEITSNWNFIPVVKKLVSAIYIPEGWQTPDDLEESYMTDKVCEIENKELVYPKQANLHEVLADITKNMSSSNELISEHAKRAYEDLKARGFIDNSGQPVVDIMVFAKEEVIDFLNL